MTLRAIHDFRVTDSTQVFNDSVRDILPKGVYFGGALAPNGRLSVNIEPFAAKSLEGLTVRNEQNTTVTIPASGHLYLIGIVCRYVPLKPAIIQPIAIRSDEIEDHPDRDFLISFGICDLTAGNEIVLSSNLSEARREAGPFSSDVDALANSFLAAAYADSFATTDFRYCTYDIFENMNDVHEADTTMTFNAVASRFESSSVGAQLVSAVLSDYDDLVPEITEVQVLVETNDPQLEVYVRANPASAWIAAQPNVRVALGSSRGDQLQVRFIAGTAGTYVRSYAVYFDRINSNLESLNLPSPTPNPVNGVTTLLNLTDTPTSYASAARKLLAVNAGANGIEFVPMPTFTYGQAQWKTVVSGYEAAAGDHIIPDNSTSAVTIVLPEHPTVGDIIFFRPRYGTRYSVRPLTLNGNGNRIMGLTIPHDFVEDDVIFDVQYLGGSMGWRLNTTGTALNV